MHDVVVSAVAAAVMAATKTFNSTSQKLFLFIRYSFLLSEHESHESLRFSCLRKEIIKNYSEIFSPRSCSPLLLEGVGGRL